MKEVFDVFGLRFTMELAGEAPPSANEAALMAEVHKRWRDAVKLAVMPWDGSRSLQLVSEGGVRIAAPAATGRFKRRAAEKSAAP